MRNRREEEEQEGGGGTGGNKSTSFRSQKEKTGLELDLRRRVHTLQYDSHHGGAVVANAYSKGLKLSIGYG